MFVQNLLWMSDKYENRNCSRNTNCLLEKQQYYIPLSWSLSNRKRGICTDKHDSCNLTNVTWKVCIWNWAENHSYIRKYSGKWAKFWNFSLVVHSYWICKQVENLWSSFCVTFKNVMKKKSEFQRSFNYVDALYSVDCSDTTRQEGAPNVLWSLESQLWIKCHFYFANPKLRLGTCKYT